MDWYALLFKEPEKNKSFVDEYDAVIAEMPKRRSIVESFKLHFLKLERCGIARKIQQVDELRTYNCDEYGPLTEKKYLLMSQLKNIDKVIRKKDIYAILEHDIRLQLRQENAIVIDGNI